MSLESREGKIMGCALVVLIFTVCMFAGHVEGCTFSKLGAAAERALPTKC